MSWMLIIGMTLILFFNRYFFLEPKVAVKLPVFIERMLRYAAPCLLSVICIPIIFFDAEGGMKPLLNNAYLYAAIFACVISLRIRNVLLSLVCSMAFFYILLFLL